MRTVKKQPIPPWKKKPPKRTKHAKLSVEEKRKAKLRADKAGRHYPNLVDNMAIIRKRDK